MAAPTGSLRLIPGASRVTGTRYQRAPVTGDFWIEIVDAQCRLGNEFALASDPTLSGRQSDLTAIPADIPKVPAASVAAGVTPAAPVNLNPPSISGVAQVGKVLTRVNGTWTNAPTSFAHQWYANGTAISGATGATYTPVTGDIGKAITVSTVATNTIGSSSVATSAATSAVIAAAAALAISGANGTANVGDTTSFTPTISGGTAPYTVTATGLPPGRSITNAATGLTTGAYTTAGSYSATYTVTDSAGATASFTRSVTVTAASSGATLNTLALSGLLTNGLPSSGIINGSTAGTTITSGLSGLTVNSVARTYAWDGTGAAGTTASALTETPTSGTAKTSPAIVLPASTGNLKLSGRQFFGGEPAMFMILAGYASTSTLGVTSDDGTTFTVGVNSQGYPLGIGTFSTVTQPTVRVLSITEGKSDGTSSVSTMAVMVSPIPAAPSAAVARAQATKLNTAAATRKSVNVGSNPPTITLNTGASNVNGRLLASGGAVPTKSVPDGASGNAGTTSATQAGGAWIYADTTNGPSAMTNAPGSSKRFVFNGTRFDFKVYYPGSIPYGVNNINLYYAEDADTANPTWAAIPDANVVFRQGTYFYDVQFPSAPARSGARAVEIVFGNGLQVDGFDFDTGTTPPAAYDDGRPRSAWWNDSYEFGPVVTQTPRLFSSGGKVVMDAFGTRNAVNFGHRTNAWARLGGGTGVHAYVADRFGSNPYALDEATTFGAQDILGGHMSINDNVVTAYTSALQSGLKFSNPNNYFVPGATTLQNMLQLAFRRMRLMQPQAMIEIDIGMHGPDASPGAAQLNAIRTAFSNVFDNDPLAVLCDLEAGTYRWKSQTAAISGFTAPLVPSGAIGSSALFPPGDCTFTGSITGNVLTVTAVSSGRLEPGMASGSNAVFNDTVNGTYIQNYGTGTGGTGTYILAYATGDKASQTFTYTGDKDHPNDTGYQRWGVERGKALTFAASRAASLGTTIGTETGLGLTTESGAAITVE